MNSTERVKLWRLENAERNKLHRQKYYELNKEKIKERAKAQKHNLTESKQANVLDLLKQGMSYNKISKLVSSCKKDIAAFAKESGFVRISNKEKDRNLITIVCSYCGKEFKDYACNNKQFCSVKCSNESNIIWTEEVIKSEILKLKDKDNFVSSFGNQTLVTVATRMFGSWDAACELVGCKRHVDRIENCSICGKPLKGLERIKFCSKECQNKGQLPRWSSYGHVRRSKYLKGDLIDKNVVYNRDGWICHICGNVINPLVKHPDSFSASLDHVVSLSKGGKHIWDNVKAAHLCCNISKSNK